jgi:ATP-dependent protease Clp ATPase subunit
MVLEYIKDANIDFKECSFCGIPEDKTTVLIAGTEACICPDCLSQANNIILEQVGITDALSRQHLITTKKINKAFVLITVLLSLAFTIIIAVTIFTRKS